MNYHSVSWDSEKKANVCFQCGHLSYGLPKTGGYDECLECKKVHLMEVQNAALAERNDRARRADDDSGGTSLVTDGVKQGLAISVMRLFLLFMLWNWILPKKVEDAALFLAVGTALAVDMFAPKPPSLMVLSPRERVVYCVLLVVLVLQGIGKLFGH